MNTHSLHHDEPTVNSLSVNWLTPSTAAAEFMSPYMLGRLTAEQGELPLPELYYPRKAEQREFARGYQSVVGSDLLSDQILGKRPPTEAEIEVMMFEYADDIEDRSFWSRGSW